MLDLIKKTMLAGIGATVTTKETIERALHDYVEKGKLSATDAQSLAERIVADGKQEFEQAKHDLGQRFQEMLKKSNFATREEMDALHKRVATLEGIHHKPAETHGHKHAEEHPARHAEAGHHKAAETTHKPAKAHH